MSNSFRLLLFLTTSKEKGSAAVLALRKTWSEELDFWRGRLSGGSKRLLKLVGFESHLPHPVAVVIRTLRVDPMVDVLRVKDLISAPQGLAGPLFLVKVMVERDWDTNL